MFSVILRFVLANGRKSKGKGKGEEPNQMDI